MVIIMIKTPKTNLTTTQYILCGFFIVIFVGSLLLSLPVSSASGNSVPYLDALFMSATSTCVTGLVTMPTITTWSLFGQVVILVLIQIGGLGVITILSALMLSLHKKFGIRDRLLIQDSFNLTSLSGLVRFTKNVLVGTLVIEGVGALLYMTVFVPDFGAKGIWISVFNSVSAFCNAGIDIVSEASLCAYALDPIVNFTTCMLIILGGIGYFVWWDVIRVLKNVRRLKARTFQSLTLHSKIVLCTTLILIIAGTIGILAFEYNNPHTIGSYTLAEKIEVSLFQSVTTRTAGFATIPQENLTSGASVLCLFLMFIGGSPTGTAGGIKTVTIAVLTVSIISTVRNKEEVVLFNRNIARQAVSKAVAVTGISFFTMFASTVLLSAVTDASALNIVFETVSATATVGLSRNLTPYLGAVGKIIIIATMYLGRVGPISLAIAFNSKKRSPNVIKNPTEDISIG